MDFCVSLCWPVLLSSWILVLLLLLALLLFVVATKTVATIDRLIDRRRVGMMETVATMDRSIDRAV
jgi:hypothetical protein